MTIDNNFLPEEFEGFDFVQRLKSGRKGVRLGLFRGENNDFKVYNYSTKEIVDIELEEGFNFNRQGEGYGKPLVFENGTRRVTYNLRTNRISLDYISQARKKGAKAFLNPISVIKANGRVSQYRGSGCCYADGTPKG